MINNFNYQIIYFDQLFKIIDFAKIILDMENGWRTLH